MTDDEFNLKTTIVITNIIDFFVRADTMTRMDLAYAILKYDEEYGLECLPKTNAFNRLTYEL